MFEPGLEKSNAARGLLAFRLTPTPLQSHAALALAMAQGEGL